MDRGGTFGTGRVSQTGHGTRGELRLRGRTVVGDGTLSWRGSPSTPDPHGGSGARGGLLLILSIAESVAGADDCVGEESVQLLRIH